MRMAAYIGLVLVTLLKLKNHQDGYGKLARVATLAPHYFEIWQRPHPLNGIINVIT